MKYINIICPHALAPARKSLYCFMSNPPPYNSNSYSFPPSQNFNAYSPQNLYRQNLYQPQGYPQQYPPLKPHDSAGTAYPPYKIDPNEQGFTDFIEDEDLDDEEDDDKSCLDAEGWLAIICYIIVIILLIAYFMIPIPKSKIYKIEEIHKAIRTILGNK